MTHKETDEHANAFPSDDPTAIFAAGIELLRAERPEVLLPHACEALQNHPCDPRMHQLLGLAARAVGDSATAFKAFGQAARYAPSDALIAHSHARAALEAGKPATALFDRAAELAPADGSVLQGRAAAQIQEGNPERAMADLTDILDRNPMWLDGHRSLAHVRGQLGMAPCEAIEAALRSIPRSPELHRLRITTMLEARDLQAADRAAHEAEQAVGTPPWLIELAAHIASERGELAIADAKFSSLPAPTAVEEAALLARHLIRAVRPEAADEALEPFLDRDPDQQLWPYRALAWRMSGDPRWQWLEGDNRLVGIYDLADQLGDLAVLAKHLRSLHFALSAPLDQSVRGGTQTDGNLLLREEAPFRVLREVLMRTVANHIEQLPEPQARHPTLLRRRGPVRIAGSWSVRLEDAGFHSDHVHNQGWLSSALYVALPESVSPEGDDCRHDGWLSLGEQRDLVPGLEPLRLVEPRLGRLVLFPSTMWHGTRPFSSGERLTIAFDIARPHQG